MRGRHKHPSRFRHARLSSRLTVISLLVVVLGLASVAVASTLTTGEVGPSLRLTANGRLLHPVGRLTTVGNFPTGSAVAAGGRVLWVTDCGHGKDDVKIVNLKSGKVVQTLALPGCYGGVTFAPGGGTAYVGGTPKGSSPTDGPTKGDQGDIVHVFKVNPETGTGTERSPIALPATTGGSGRLNSLPPVSGVGTAQPDGVAVSPNGRYLVVALNAADQAVVIDLHTGAQHLVAIGSYPNGVAFDRGGSAYVSNEYSGTVSVIDPASAKVTTTISGLGGSLGDLGSHPEGMVADPKRSDIYVAVTNRDLVAVISTASKRVSKLVSVARPQGLGTAPVKLAISPDDATLYAADSGEDAVAAISLSKRPAAKSLRKRRVYLAPSVTSITTYHAKRKRLAKHPAARYQRELLALQHRYLRVRTSRSCTGPTHKQAQAFVNAVLRALNGSRKRRAAALSAAAARLPKTGCRLGYIPNLPAYRLIGRLPTSAYPDDVQTTPQGQLVWISGKGFGSGPNPTYYFGGARTPLQTPPNVYGTYVLDMLIGRVGSLPVPTDRQILADSAIANAQARPNNPESRPAGSPIPAALGAPSAQIKHVFYIVRENRTYDQIFGSDPRGDGNPKLELFDDNGVSGPTGGITPNAHALTRQFPLLDHFYEDSEVSVDGHIITSTAYATDYAQKATAANYSNRRGTYDFGIYPVSFPPKFFIFDQAAKQNVSFRDYGEYVGAITTTAAQNRPEFAKVAAGLDATYPGNVFIGCLSPGSVATCTQDSGVYKGTGSLFAGQSRFNIWNAEFQTQVLSGTVPAFNYMILPNDHTNGTTPKDFTPQAMIADNDLALGQMVDAISHSSIWPSTAIFVVEDDSQDGADHVDSHRAPAFVISPWARHGTVVHTRYDQYSMLRTVELILGLDPLALNDALATPMYDAFISGSQTPNDAPYGVTAPTYSLSTTNAATAADARLSSELPWNRLDAVPQEISDEILWASAHGAHGAAPAPGPNASLDEHDRAVIVRSILRQTPRAFLQKLTTRSLRNARCPITWACRASANGEP
jgi:YVTN family beta-propeller protein